MLNYYQLPIQGLNAVVVGASTIVGRPMAWELLLAKATVSICNSQTSDLKTMVEQADLLVVATGVKHLIKPEWLHKQQIVIDVGIHRLENGKVEGDLDFNACKKRVAWITPVPGGVGPMTISILLKNTLMAYDHHKTLP